MSRDALNRRARTARPAASSSRIVLSAADHLLFHAIARHGPLPSNYLYEFTKHLRRDRSHLQNRLTDFYNGDARGSYLLRPRQQFASYCGHYQHLVYDLAPRARIALAECGVREVGGNGRGEPFVHRLMGSCIGASFELLAPEFGLRYIPLSEILSRETCEAARHPHPLALPLAGSGNAMLIPDRLFGLHYPGAGYRFFAVECDRHTESIERRNLRQSALARKFAAYLSILRSQHHRAWWGIPNLHVLIVTTNEMHAEHILRYLREVPEPFRDRFAVVSERTFGADWRVPNTLLTHLLDRPWPTSAGVKHIGLPTNAAPQ